MREKPQINDFKSIEQLYGLSDSIRWELVGQNHMNESWYGFESAAKKFVLRRYRRDCADSELKEEHNLLFLVCDYLEKLIAAPILNTERNSISFINGERFALFPYKQGIPMSRGVLGQISPAASTLASLHSIGPTLGKRVAENYKQSRPAVHAEYFENKMSFINDGALNIQILRGASVNYDVLKYACERAVKTLEKLSNARRFPIHGDYNFGNILCDPCDFSVNAVLDWEESRWDSPLFDLAASSQMFCQNEYSNDLEGDFIPVYLDHLDSNLREEAKSFMNLLPDIRRTVWLRELFLVSGCDNPPLGYIQHLARWIGPDS